MEFFLRTLVNFLLETNLIYHLLVLAGIWAVLWWSIENFKSILQIAKNVLTPYFQPQENKTLVERYGKWAGMTDSKVILVENVVTVLVTSGRFVVCLPLTSLIETKSE